MIGVLKVKNLDYSIGHRQIRNIFKECGTRPADVHIVTDSNNLRSGVCFVSFEDMEMTKLGLNVDGFVCKNKRIEVRESNPGEFNRYFPGVSLVSKPPFGGYGKGKRKGIARNFRKAEVALQNDKKPFPFYASPSASRGRDSFVDRGKPLVGNIKDIFDSSFERKRYENDAGDHRGRSRSPLNRKTERGSREEFLRNFEQQESSRDQRFSRGSRRKDTAKSERVTTFHAPLGNILNIKKYVKVKGLSYSVSEAEIQKFFRPTLTKDIFYVKHHKGKFAGEWNGSVMVEFFSENDAKKCLKLDGKRFGNKVAVVSRPEMHEMERVMQGRLGNPAPPAELPYPGITPNLANIGSIANSNPQVAHLLNLLTETVNAIATASGSNSQANDSRGRRSYTNHVGNERQGSDSIVNCVADTANIDVNDITMGRVVCIRNLPYSVTPSEIVQFFEGYHAIQDSVRVHYLEDGKCSGDALVSFRSGYDAEKGIAALNRKKIAGKRLELFLL